MRTIIDTWGLSYLNRLKDEAVQQLMDLYKEFFLIHLRLSKFNFIEITIQDTEVHAMLKIQFYFRQISR